MAIYEIGPELENREVVHSGLKISMKKELFPTDFRPGFVARVGETALADQDIDLITETFGPLELEA